jgi:hypothetical protein
MPSRAEPACRVGARAGWQSEASRSGQGCASGSESEGARLCAWLASDSRTPRTGARRPRAVGPASRARSQAAASSAGLNAAPEGKRAPGRGVTVSPSGLRSTVAKSPCTWPFASSRQSGAEVSARTLAPSGVSSPLSSESSWVSRTTSVPPSRARPAAKAVALRSATMTAQVRLTRRCTTRWWPPTKCLPASVRRCPVTRCLTPRLPGLRLFPVASRGARHFREWP